MDGKTLLELYYNDIISSLSVLKSDDIEKLKKGNYGFKITIKRKTDKKRDINLNVKNEYEKILKEITSCQSKDVGRQILNSYFTQKNELINFAKYLNVSIQAKEKTEVIVDRIIEATVGAILRSNAIQGKDIGNSSI